MGPIRRLLILIVVGAACTGGTNAQTARLAASRSTHDWTRFGWDPARSNSSGDATGIDATNVGSLVRQQVPLDGTVDASAIYLHGVTVRGSAHDVFFVTTTYGKTIAIDAANGATLWTFTPSSYGVLSGSRQVTTATPVADPDREFVYAAAPDGNIRKLAVASGQVAWTTSITRLASREKVASALNFDRGHVIATTGGYIGDAPPYQGHVVILDGKTGAVLHVWNSLCSDSAGLIHPAQCGESGSAIWGRAGAVIDTTTGDIFVATGNGKWDGRRNWGDAMLVLDGNATTLLANYTPTNTESLDGSDADLGSTAPALLGGTLVAQGGKDGRIRLLDWNTLRGVTPHRGGELQLVPTPSGSDLFTAPAVWHRGATTGILVADNSGTASYTIVGGALHATWRNGNGGTSPVIAGGLGYVYDPAGSLRVYELALGRELARLSAGGGHWNSPIVVDGRIALPEGDSNAHRMRGVLNIYRLP